MDYTLFELINGLANQNQLLDSVMIFFAEYAQYAFVLGLLYYWFSKNRKRILVIQAGTSGLIALSISGILGSIFYHNRPFVDHHVAQLIDHPINASFPSDHTTAAFVLATSFYLYARKTGLFWLILAFFISFSRIFVGVHYPTDTIGGMALGILCAVAIHRLFSTSKKIKQWLRENRTKNN